MELYEEKWQPHDEVVTKLLTPYANSMWILPQVSCRFLPSHETGFEEYLSYTVAIAVLPEKVGDEWYIACKSFASREFL